MPVVNISKTFGCSKEALYQAWTGEAELKQWWKPMGNQLVTVENDIKLGGHVSYTFADEKLLITGVYEKAEEHNLLVYTWNWHVKAEPVHDAEYKLSVQFDGDDTNATLTIKQDGFKDGDSIEPHEQGWNHALEQLAQHLQTNNSEQQPKEAEKQKPPITGYMETPNK